MVEHRSPRIALLGRGAIGLRVEAALRQRLAPGAALAALVRRPVAQGVAGIDFFIDLDALLDWAPDLAVECAGHAVVAQAVPALLRTGADVVIASVGALGDAGLRRTIEAAARAGGARPIVPSGAVGGLDALRAARQAGLRSVRYTGRKPPRAWAGTPAEARCVLADIRQPTVVFEGNAADAARAFPKNANVTAAVALAGAGFERTTVTLVADPDVNANVHELQASGSFGELSLRLANAPLPDNPKTSWLAALSIEAVLRDVLHPSSFHASDWN
ncbi:aspartate dehydrogenase [Pseudorhodoferax sp. LjRoot39]|uniref:aspartate dehydrogenase n=1 Tax=Pseudorhodoferax sp. LjRoot39 TaxID=3342328 RepID=UPI003ED0A759